MSIYAGQRDKVSQFVAHGDNAAGLLDQFGSFFLPLCVCVLIS